MIDHLEVDLRAKFESAQGLRQSILRYAFAGQLAPQDPNDEPSSQLLKRIVAGRGNCPSGSDAKDGSDSPARGSRSRGPDAVDSRSDD